MKKIKKKKKYPKRKITTGGDVMRRGGSLKTTLKKMGPLKKKPAKKPKQKERKQKEKYLVNLKREKALAGKGWKVARTRGYLKKPKQAIGKKGYPYAVLNKEENYETFYTWKEKPVKKKRKKKKKKR